jgi:crossover junction endodeoxyribonuclease RusA
MKVILELPLPPTANLYYRRGRYATYMSDRGRQYKQDVADIVSSECFVKFGDARLRMHINLHPATRGKSDLDNRLKALQDSLMSEGAGVFNDDSQIDDLRIVRCGVVKGGKAIVIIEAIDG